MLRFDRNGRCLVRRAGVSVAAAIAIALGCRGVSIDDVAPVLKPAPGADVTAERLAAGRSIYISETKCAGCHNPKQVHAHTADEWSTVILPRMAKKAKLSSDEYENVLAYVTAGSRNIPLQRTSP